MAASMTKVTEQLRALSVFEHHKSDSGEDILPRMRHHSRTQAASRDREQTEKRTVYSDRDHAARAFISVRNSKQK